MDTIDAILRTPLKQIWKSRNCSVQRPEMLKKFIFFLIFFLLRNFLQAGGIQFWQPSRKQIARKAGVFRLMSQNFEKKMIIFSKNSSFFVLKNWNNFSGAYNADLTTPSEKTDQILKLFAPCPKLMKNLQKNVLPWMSLLTRKIQIWTPCWEYFYQRPTVFGSKSVVDEEFSFFGEKFSSWIFYGHVTCSFVKPAEKKARRPNVQKV